jgi:hypothetical protein
LSNLPIVLIEVVLVFGGVLAFGIWQLRSLKKDGRPRDKRTQEQSKEQR